MYTHKTQSHMHIYAYIVYIDMWIRSIFRDAAPSPLNDRHHGGPHKPTRLLSAFHGAPAASASLELTWNTAWNDHGYHGYEGIVACTLSIQKELSNEPVRPTSQSTSDFYSLAAHLGWQPHCPPQSAPLESHTWANTAGSRRRASEGNVLGQQGVGSYMLQRLWSWGLWQGNHHETSTVITWWITEMM